MRYDFEKLERLLSKHNIRLSDRHWILSDSANRNKVVREILTTLGDNRTEDKRFRLRKKPSCLYENCVNPNCWTFTGKPCLVNHSSFVDREDFEAAVEDFDLDEFERVGFETYLNAYNSSLPEFLRLSNEQLKEVYAYVKKNNNE